ncbi:FkbM family methyltransferase [Bradyrhizobium neotropicale]|uniref:FkbM family methyltransferase n=1 Tax=Bradyrhizobium neotropicale TaxID=1497615 RepID=UPI000B309148|nr:FkbM family methyltransferase [Bradyrhizobium neotropicale]
MIRRLIRHLRRNPLDFGTRNALTIGAIVFAPLDRAECLPIVVDVGARNGMSLLPSSFAGRAHLIGFEPSRTEFEKLRDGRTDALAHGADIPRFKVEEYHPVAMWDQKEERTFYLTSGPNFCTLMGESVQPVADAVFLDKGPFGSFHEVHTRLLSTDKVVCDTLDNIVGNRTVDLLKLDVEGGEAKCLEGARRLLREHRALVIYSEFQTFPYYHNHGLLGDQQVVLNAHGYRLLDLDLGHPTYRRHASARVPKSADRRMLMAGDAIFVLDPDRTEMLPEIKQRLAAISMALGFISFALSLLREANLNTSDEIDAIEEAASKAWTVQRIRRSWNALPSMVGSRL